MVLVIMILEIAFFLLLEQWVYRRYWDDQLNISLRFKETVIYEKDTSVLEEMIENQKRLPLPMLKVKFSCSRHLLFEKEKNNAVSDLYYRNDVFTAMPMQRITRKLSFVADKRGFYAIHGVDLQSRDLFYSKKYIGERDIVTSMYVLPRPYVAPGFERVLQKISGELLSKRHLLTDPFENQGIRPYEPYDSMRMINWKATAKTKQLQVNQKNYTALQAVRIILNLDDHSILRREELLEYSIRMTARLAEELLELGVRVSVYSNTADCLDGECLDVQAGAGVGQIETIMKGLARIDLEKRALPLEALRAKLMEETTSTCTVIFSPNKYEEFQQILLDYANMDSDFFWICPYFEGRDQLEFEIEEELEKYYQPVVCERE